MLPVREKTHFRLLIVESGLLLVSFFFLGGPHIVTGILSGIFISLVSLFFLTLGLRRFAPGDKGGAVAYFFRGFVVRLVSAGIFLYLFIVLLKSDVAGLVIGLLLGLVINTLSLLRLIKETKGT